MTRNMMTHWNALQRKLAGLEASLSGAVESAVAYLALYLVLFASVLVHELAHSFVALKSGSSVKQIVLWPLGGIASVGFISDPVKEFKISVAGPLTSIAIGLALLEFIMCSPSVI